MGPWRIQNGLRLVSILFPKDQHRFSLWSLETLERVPQRPEWIMEQTIDKESILKAAREAREAACALSRIQKSTRGQSAKIRQSSSGGTWSGMSPDQF